MWYSRRKKNQWTQIQINQNSPNPEHRKIKIEKSTDPLRPGYETIPINSIYVIRSPGGEMSKTEKRAKTPQIWLKVLIRKPPKIKKL